jgi:hypothetical protein
MGAQRSFLADSVEKLRNKFDSLYASDLATSREVDSDYRAQESQNLKEGEKHFMWGEASKILTMAMSAVLMGGVTGSAIKFLTAVSWGMPILAGAGALLAVGALGAAYLSFKSQGQNATNKSETYASMLARKQEQALAPSLSKAIGAEMREAIKEGVQEGIKELKADQQAAMIAGAANTNGAVDAAVANVPTEKVENAVASPAPKVTITQMKSPEESKPSNNIVPFERTLQGTVEQERELAAAGR